MLDTTISIHNVDDLEIVRSDKRTIGTGEVYYVTYVKVLHGGQETEMVLFSDKELA